VLVFQAWRDQWRPTA